MRKNVYFINILLAAAVGGLCLWGMLLRLFAPSVLLPHVSIPMLVLVTAIALIAERYLGGGGKREWIGSTLLAGLTFALLPLCAGLAANLSVGALFLVGCAVFFLVALLYTSMCDRMASGSAGKLAPLINGLLLVLAAQFFIGIL